MEQPGLQQLLPPGGSSAAAGAIGRLHQGPWEDLVTPVPALSPFSPVVLEGAGPGQQPPMTQVCVCVCVPCLPQIIYSEVAVIRLRGVYVCVSLGCRAYEYVCVLCMSQIIYSGVCVCHQGMGLTKKYTQVCVIRVRGLCVCVCVCVICVSGFGLGGGGGEGVSH